MARYTGPKHKLSRRVGYDIWGGSSKSPAARRPYPPGQHGSKAAGGRGGAGGRKQSNYGKHLLEKQKLRTYYGMLEKQFRNTYKKASRLRGVKGDNFLMLLESRLDAVVYRSGFAPTIFAARQLVAHGHFKINGVRSNCPSQRVKPGDMVSSGECRRF
jgi:small subunit ribosomal protein S4